MCEPPAYLHVAGSRRVVLKERGISHICDAARISVKVGIIRRRKLRRLPLRLDALVRPVGGDVLVGPGRKAVDSNGRRRRALLGLQGKHGQQAVVQRLGWRAVPLSPK